METRYITLAVFNRRGELSRRSSLAIGADNVRIVGVLQHGETIRPDTPADAQKLREWLDALVFPQ